MVTWFDVNHCAPELSVPFQKEHTQLIEGVVKDRNESGVCVVLCRAEQVFRLQIGHNAASSGWELAFDLGHLGHAFRTPGSVCRSLLSDEKLLQQVGWAG